MYLPMQKEHLLRILWSYYAIYCSIIPYVIINNPTILEIWQYRYQLQRKKWKANKSKEGINKEIRQVMSRVQKTMGEDAER